MVRDGRDVMVSRYFSLLVSKGAKQRQAVEASLGITMRADNARENMPAFIQYLVNDRRSSVDYRTHIETYLKYKDEYASVRYESLIADTGSAFAGVIRQLVGDEPHMDRVQEAVAACSFQALSGRRPGHESPTAFLRKGVSGDWRNHFSLEAASVFDAYAGDLLVKLGYEPNNGWVAQCASHHEGSREVPPSELD